MRHYRLVRPWPHRRAFYFAVPLAVIVWLLIFWAFGAFAQDTKPDDERRWCYFGALAWIPPLEQGVCGVTSLELLWRGVCHVKNGDWHFEPGGNPSCTWGMRKETKDG